MIDSALAKLIQPIASLLRPVWNYCNRLWKERRAGQNLFPEEQLRLMDVEFDKTLARIRGEESEDGWLGSMLTAIAHPVITPQFLQQQGVKDWLAIQQVRDDLKALATRQLLGNTTPDVETRKRLIDAYTSISTNPAATAIEATNGIVAVLVAGHQASLETNPATVAGFIQAASTENRGAFERVSEQVSSVAERLNSIGPDALVVRVHTEQASEELTGILKRRSFRTEEARDQIQALVENSFQRHCVMLIGQ